MKAVHVSIQRYVDLRNIFLGQIKNLSADLFFILNRLACFFPELSDMQDVYWSVIQSIPTSIAIMFSIRVNLGGSIYLCPCQVNICPR